MPRSLRVQPAQLSRVKLALQRNGYPSQRALAEEIGLSLATVSNFLTGKPVDFRLFEELSRQLGLEWKEIANLDFETKIPTKPQTLENLTTELDNSPPYHSGAVPLCSPFYLERKPVEAQIKQEIRKPGALIRIIASKEMGKTSLLLRILEFAKAQNYHTVSLNLDQVDRAILNDLNQFLRWLCANIACQLHLKPRLDDYWEQDLGSKISCTSYFEDYLLKFVQAPLVLALDEAHQIFEHSAVAQDFLPLLRSWHEAAKISSPWQKLRLVFVHSTEICLPLRFNQPLFNVGLPIQLSHFSQEEVKRLAQCYSLHWEQREHCQKLMDIAQVHPALVQIALYHLSRGEMTLEHSFQTSVTNVDLYAHHLQPTFRRLAPLQNNYHEASRIVELCPKNILNNGNKFSIGSDEFI